jgi:predicted transcriptional regulator
VAERRRGAGVLEQEVLAVLAANKDAALTPGEVRDALGRELAYTTVMTALVRLCDKGALSRERARRGYAYRMVADSATLTARQMRRLLDRDADRPAALARFVEELGPDNERLLNDLLSNLDRRQQS